MKHSVTTFFMVVEQFVFYVGVCVHASSRQKIGKRS